MMTSVYIMLADVVTAMLAFAWMLAFTGMLAFISIVVPLKGINHNNNNGIKAKQS